MQITANKAEALKRSFDITVPTKDVELKVKALIEDLGKNLRVDGFRPGKIPFTIVQQHVGAKARVQALESLVQQGTDKALSENKLQAASQPSLEVKQRDAGKDFKFTIALEVMPEIKIKDMSKYTFEKFKIKSTEKDVQDMLKGMTQGRDINEKLAKEVGFKSLKEMEEFAKDLVDKQQTRAAFLYVKRMVLDKLAIDYDFPIPGAIVDREFKVIWREAEKSLEDEKEAKPSKEEIKKYRGKYQKIAQRRVRLGLLLSEIGNKNKIVVTEAELSQAIRIEIQNYPGPEKDLIDYYRNNPSALTAVRAPIFEEKVVKFIIEKSKISEREINFDEFKKKIEKLEKESDVNTA